MKATVGAKCWEKRSTDCCKSSREVAEEKVQSLVVDDMTWGYSEAQVPIRRARPIFNEGCRIRTSTSARVEAQNNPRLHVPRPASVLDLLVHPSTACQQRLSSFLCNLSSLNYRKKVMKNPYAKLLRLLFVVSFCSFGALDVQVPKEKRYLEYLQILQILQILQLSFLILVPFGAKSASASCVKSGCAASRAAT